MGLLIIILAILVWRFGIFSVKDFEVKTENINCVDENQIKNSVSIKGQNFFFIDKNKIENNLKKKFICIKSAEISKSFPGKLTLKLFGRQTVAALINLKTNEASVSALLDNVATPSAQEAKGVYGVDEENIIFTKDIDQAALPKIYTGSTSISLGKSDDSMKDALKIFEKIKTFGESVDKGWKKDEDFIVYLTNSTKIVFRLNSSLDIQLASLQLILSKAKIDSKEVEFIDLRFDKPVVKFAPKKKN